MEFMWNSPVNVKYIRQTTLLGCTSKNKQIYPLMTRPSLALKTKHFCFPTTPFKNHKFLYISINVAV